MADFWQQGTIPFDVKIVWHDGPGMQVLYSELKEANFNLDRERAVGLDDAGVHLVRARCIRSRHP